MIVAGIDEAGYGPLLGPLVVGCCAFELAADSADTSLGEVEGNDPVPACIWKRSRKCLRKTRSRNGRTLHVNDSKLVYSSGNLVELERAVLTIATAAGSNAQTLASLLNHVAPHVCPELGRYPWYSAEGETFPFENDATDLRMRANALRVEFQRTKTTCVHLGARVLSFSSAVGNSRLSP